MKAEHLNPWAIIRWAVVALLFAGTVTIAVDQMKTKDRALAAAKREIGLLEVDARKANVSREKVGKQAAEIEQLEQQITTLEAGKQFDAKLLHNMALRAVVAEKKLTDFLAAPASATASTVSTTYAGYAAPAPAAPRMMDAPVIPAWAPPAPSMVTKTIRERAVAEYKDNFSGLNYEIERQTEAFEKIVRYYKTADPFIKSAINKAALEYGFNYSSFAYDVERQIEARQKFQSR